MRTRPVIGMGSGRSRLGRVIRRAGPGLVIAVGSLPMGCAAPTPGPSGVAPTPGPTAVATAREEPTAGAARSADPLVTSPPGPSADDPADLPRVPGARLLSRETERDDGLETIELDYRVEAAVDRVRQHYRRVMREHGWSVGDVEVDEDGWELEASRGPREVEIEIERAGDATFVEVAVSEPVDRGR